MIPYNFMILTRLLFQGSVFIAVSVTVVLIAHNHVACTKSYKSKKTIFQAKNELNLSQVYSNFEKLILDTVLMMERPETYFKVKIGDEQYTRNFAEMYLKVLKWGEHLNNNDPKSNRNVLGCSNFDLYMKLFTILNNKLKKLLVELEDLANKGDGRQDPECLARLDALKIQYRPIVNSLNHNLRELIYLAMLANPVVESWELELPKKCSKCKRNSTILYHECTHRMDISCLVTSYIFHDKKCFRCKKWILKFLDDH
ncbi:hypothetical protein VCUG_00503 [Vavraia culicis subsp. floridensis]|uniref:Uncharacterized protein n=1 Tax=Vavraia culicis (isolate floridensis) TaxID=948595 RepID=L2GYB2_VAVCU|nr:uncharacterized protein VCUG_00503 [Vavraia culicis subsp. floridensis]ELA48080.1 hypothetical protein VCUG_00503 [Vavraia culicis subsp. floridensis]